MTTQSKITRGLPRSMAKAQTSSVYFLSGLSVFAAVSFPRSFVRLCATTNSLASSVDLKCLLPRHPIRRLLEDLLRCLFGLLYVKVGAKGKVLEGLVLRQLLHDDFVGEPVDDPTNELIHP